MSEIKEFNGGKFKKLKVKSFVINGKESSNTITYDDIKNKNINVDIIIEDNNKNKEVESDEE